MLERQERRQFFATLIVNLMMLAHGAACGWTSPAFLVLQTANQTVLPSGPISGEDSSWISATLCLGGLTGTIIFGFLVDRLGRKRCLLLNAFPHLFSWITILLAKNVIHLCLARFLAGIGGGGAFVITPLFIAEIADDHIRGALGSLIVLICNLGILIFYVLGYFFSYFTYNAICISIPVLYFIGVLFLPETPKYLIKTRQLQQAEHSLRFYQNLSCQSPIQLDNKLDSESDSSISDEKNTLTRADFCNKVARKGFFIGGVLMWLNQFCGLFAMINYTATIFENAGSSLSPNLSAIIIAVIQLLACYVSTLLVDRFGRRILLGTSATGIGLGLFCLGLFIFLKTDLGYDLEAYSWISIVCFAVPIFVGNIGVMNLPVVVISEIFPEKIKSVAHSICMLLMWGQAFLVVKYFGSISQVVGMHYCFFFFSMCATIGAIFIGIYVPETKGKSFDQIMKMLES